LRTPTEVLVRQFALACAEHLEPRYNIAPTQQVPVIRLTRDGGGRELVSLRWGLVPFWSREPSAGGRLINARAETVASKPAFRAAFRRRRCLVPADGYFEGRQEGNCRQPYYIRLRDDQPFAMAGVWDSWHDKSDANQGRLDTCAIITTAANDLTRGVHDRMPAILAPGRYDSWLDPAIENLSGLVEMLRPYSENSMVMDRVSTRVNSVRNDDPQCIDI
jgi:putative SOS response-associated peptidase YedK